MMNLGLPAPNMGCGPDEQVLLSWNRQPHHLEVEIFMDGTMEWFYLHLDTNEMWSYDKTPDATLPPEVIAKLQEFAKLFA